MKSFRFAVLAVFFAVLGLVAFASPLAAENPPAAALSALIILWSGSLLISPVAGERLPDGSIAPLQFCAITAAASLKLDKVLTAIVTSLRQRLAPLLMFSSKVDAKEVPRDHVVQVPFVTLEQMASKDWNPAVGYEDGNFNVQTRPVPLNRRKYQPLTFTMDDLRGLPAEVLALAMAQKTDRLAADIVADVFSIVTAANFGAPIRTEAASAFTTDDIADIDTECTIALWPATGRNLILDATYTGNVKKDPAIKNAAASGSTQTLREGVIGRVSSFDVSEVPGLPENGERLKGIAALQNGILIATAPVEATEEVKVQLSDYRLITDPVTGLTLTYRAWGNPDFDTAKRVVEVGYGFAKGDPAQLKRIVAPAP